MAASVLVASSCNAFPTAENFAKLVRPGPADAVDDFPAVHEQLLRLRQKRLLVDDLSGDPIDGVCSVVYYLYIPCECPSFFFLFVFFFFLFFFFFETDWYPWFNSL